MEVEDATRSNCTLLELKHASITTDNCISFRSNCTLLELKHGTQTWYSEMFTGSNCTLLELKHLSTILGVTREEFKLHLTGIETETLILHVFRFAGSNCTLLELKQVPDYRIAL